MDLNEVMEELDKLANIVDEYATEATNYKDVEDLVLIKSHIRDASGLLYSYMYIV
jgi:hypothetical protein